MKLTAHCEFIVKMKDSPQGFHLSSDTLEEFKGRLHSFFISTVHIVKDDVFVEEKPPDALVEGDLFAESKRTVLLRLCIRKDKHKLALKSLKAALKSSFDGRSSSTSPTATL